MMFCDTVRHLYCSTEICEMAAESEQYEVSEQGMSCHH